MTDISNNSKPDFDDSDNNEFDPILSTNYKAVDNNIDVD